MPTKHARIKTKRWTLFTTTQQAQTHYTQTYTQTKTKHTRLAKKMRVFIQTHKWAGLAGGGGRGIKKKAKKKNNTCVCRTDIIPMSRQQKKVKGGDGLGRLVELMSTLRTWTKFAGERGKH